MSQELLDLVDENNILTGVVKSREAVHRDKVDWHRVVHIWIMNDRGEFLCQQRSWKKDSNPGAWQSFFGGHLKTGQTKEEWVKEELIEEIGIDITKLQKQPIYIHTRIREKSKHFGYTYILKWNGTLNDLIFNDGEVERVAWIKLDLLRIRIDKGEFCNKLDQKVIECIQDTSGYSSI